MYGRAGFLIFLLFGFLCLANGSLDLYAEDNESTGTLLVSYQTGPKGERLERVRFRLIGEGRDPQLYPKGQAILSQTPHPTHHVALENLPAGDYSIEFLIPNHDSLFEPVLPKKITIEQGKIVKVDQYIRPRYATLQAHSVNLPNHKPFTELPRVSLHDSKGNLRAESTVGRLIVHYLVPGSYQLTYSKLTGYKTPKAEEIALTPNENKGPIIGEYIEEDTAAAAFGTDLATVLVSAGPVILGDPNDAATENTDVKKIIDIPSFNIGIYEVTNEQYSDWLSLAYSEERVYYSPDKARHGLVLDKEGNVLCKTFEADPKSQITYQNEEGFRPVFGKNQHPVIFVTWVGAIAFCKDQNCRLPSEAEWEKAAGMAPHEEDKPLKKYRYGFSSDTINPANANYKVSDSKESRMPQVLTEDVGYYNGQNLVPERNRKGDLDFHTTLSKSPYGAFDMSGNVWEWTSDKAAASSNQEGRIVKGGCYDSLAEGVRVSERLALPLGYADEFTGFRIAR